jgi:hypothetical protein
MGKGECLQGSWIRISSIRLRRLKREHWATTNVYMDAVKVYINHPYIISGLTGDYRKNLTLNSVRGASRLLSCIYSLNLGPSDHLEERRVRSLFV